MPQMSGLDLIERVMKNHPDMHFALMTAYKARFATFNDQLSAFAKK